MPARSQAQRGYLAAHFGPEWMKEHHFNNKGKLPKRVKDHRPKAEANAKKNLKKAFE